MDKYVTVVSVDDDHSININNNINGNATLNVENNVQPIVEKSQFITVLSINDGATTKMQPEELLVYRLPGERLGFGLKFQGGTKNNEKIQRLFIQSCSENSPASRVQASWGFLREGDEILEIDGVSVTKMTRIECVKCLKESNVAIKLLVKNGEGKAIYEETSDFNGEKPSPPPVPPRKLNRRKSKESTGGSPVSEQKPIIFEHIPAPIEADSYSSTFTDTESETSLRENESDDTASTISTIIDKFSICSSLSSESDFSISINQNSELAKALKPFTLLEQEFNLENKLELLSFKPVQKREDYENVSVQKDKNYENVIFKNEFICNEYENVEIKVPPRPMPRQAVVVEPKKRSQEVPVVVVPPPRAKTTKLSSPTTTEFNTIQTWLQEATEVIHECAIVEEIAEAPIQAMKLASLPRLVDAIPKASMIKQTINNNNEGETGMVIIKKCIKICENDSENEGKYGDSSSSDDEDEEKIYEPGQMERMNDVFGTYSDEDGEKLGPPEIVGVGGPSEAYFNYPWAAPLLPTIGEVEEEMSSLEPTGPIVIINTFDETCINNNDNNNNDNGKIDQYQNLADNPVQSTQEFVQNVTDNEADIDDKQEDKEESNVADKNDNENDKSTVNIDDTSLECKSEEILVSLVENSSEKMPEVKIEEKSSENERIILGVEHSTQEEIDSVDVVDAPPPKQEKEPETAPQKEGQNEEESTNLNNKNMIMDNTNTAKLIPSPIVKVTPPAFSRLPPDGHEFPPNFNEPFSVNGTNKHSNIINYDDIPDLPKSNPPPVPRKVYKQELNKTMDDKNIDENPPVFKKPPFNTRSYTQIDNFTSEHRRRSIDEAGSGNRVKLLGSNWRKDEKSEKSVRDKIAMFSNGENDCSPKRQYSKDFAKSSENLLNESLTLDRRTSETIECYATLRKKALSVENLDETDRAPTVNSNGKQKPAEITNYTPKIGLEKSKPVILGRAYSVESLTSTHTNNKLLLRATSFQSDTSNNEEKRRSSISNLLEQRKKSMSKLRGLVIPEKVPETEVLPDIGLPIIKSKDSEKILSSNILPKINESSEISYARKTSTLPNPKTTNGHYSQQKERNPYRNIFRNKSEEDPVFKMPIPPVPPAKPPRTSLTVTSNSKLTHDYQKSQTTEDESDDSDSLMSSRISSPPISPIVSSTPEKYVLTRTLSSETNTSITSSNSTLTSSSGSQASCSSVGSTPLDMSRKISKSSSNEMSMNRKNVLASAKSRSGRAEMKIDEGSFGRTKRYEDEDSTDGYDEDERKFTKTKLKTSLSNGSSSKEREIYNYKVVDKTDNIVDKVIKVASYVEVVSDLDQSIVDTEIIETMTSIPVVEPEKLDDNSELAKWVRHEAAKAVEIKEHNDEIQIKMTKRELRSSVDSKKMNLSEIRKNFESKSNASTVVPTPVIKTAPKETKANGNHDRFSSWDSLASSSSSGVSSLQPGQNCNGSNQALQSPPSDYGSFSSLGSSHSLMTPQDLQLIIEEADPPLATPEAFVVVLQRETPESSIGITLAGGSDYEAKEITIHKILTSSPADKDGRLKRGDRILSINGLSMRGLTHRESLTVLKTPRPEVVMVVTRSKSLIIDSLSKSKRPSLGSLSSLAEKCEINDYDKKKIMHKASRSLDLDLDVVSNEAESVFDGTSSEDGILSTDESKCSSINPTVNEVILDQATGYRDIEIMKDGAGLGFSIEGGYDSPTGNKPLMVKKVFMGGAAEKSGKVRAGQEILAINGKTIEKMNRIEVWHMMKKLPNGMVKITLRK